MQEQLTSKLSESASRLTRRNFLAGATAINVSALPTAVGAGTSDELAWMTDQRREYTEQIIALDEANYILSQREDRPPPPAVRMSDITALYAGTSLACRDFNHLAAIEREMKNEAAKHWLGDEWRNAALADWNCLRNRFNARLKEWDDWHVTVGYRANEDLIDSLSNLRGKLDDAIAFSPCHSLRDVALKLDYVEETVNFDCEHWLLLPDLLKTLSDFAHGRPASRRERAAVAGAV